MNLARNVFGLLERSAESRYGDRSAFGFEGDVGSYRQMRDAALRLAGGLAEHGVRPGDKVAVMLGNRLEWVETFFRRVLRDPSHGRVDHRFRLSTASRGTRLRT